MSRGGRVALLAAVAVAAALWGAATGARAVSAVALAIAAASLLRRSPVPVSTPAQALLLLASGLLALALTTLIPADEALGGRSLQRGWVLVGGTSLLLMAARSHVLRPEGGSVITLGLGLLVFLACGSVRSGPIYPVLLLGYAMLLFATLHLEDRERPAWRELGWRHRGALAVIAASAAALTAGILLALPGLSRRADAWVLRWLESRVQSGFHDGPMMLGALEGMLQSDEIVLRVEGPAGELLRGNVYTRYARQHWLAPRERQETTRLLSDPLEPHAADVTVIRYADDDGDRFFLPLDAAELQLVPGRVRTDALGVARALPDATPELVRLRRGSSRRLPPAAPGREDLALPEPLRPRLEALAREWTRAAATPSARVDALRARLERDYTYSLDFERADARARAAPDFDPVLHFLFEDRQGHCEYFASAMALLARASSVPARVATGYRVWERNPLGGYYIVRQRHAHAWVEVHLPERGWVSVDPSPLRSFEQNPPATTAFVAGLLDWGALALQRGGPTPPLLALLVLFAAIQVRRLLRDRRRAPSAKATAASQPPRDLKRLLGWLEELGWPRGQGESLEAYARRLSRPAARPEPEPESEASGAPLCAAESLLLRYAALRYGGLGSADALRADVHAWLSTAASPPR